MRRIVIAVLLLFFLCDAISGTKKEFWEEKDYKQWSAQECSKILNNSPWTKNFTEEFGEGGWNYLVQFQSALPVRQALVRQDQILAKYDSLSPEQRMAFDQNAETLLSSSVYSDKIFISLIISADPRIDAIRSRRSPYTKSVFLYGSSGKRAQLIDFISQEAPKTRGIQFVFPRQVEGRPLIDSKDKELILECPFDNNYNYRANCKTPESSEN
jgi:hypothetical protein